MQEASHRFGSWALEEACSGSSSGVRNRIIKLVKLQWRDQSPFSYSTPVPLRVLQLLWHAGSLAVDAAAANEERGPRMRPGRARSAHAVPGRSTGT